MLKKLAFASVGIIMMAAPALALAQSSDVQSQIAALMAQIRQLTALIAQLQGQQSEQSNCVDLSTNLTLGSNGPDVQMLQNYLIKTGVLDAQYNTGYYGFITAKAVGTMQMNLGVLFSVNDPAYGIAGPRTRAVLACNRNTLPPGDGSASNKPSAWLDVSSMSFSTGGKDTAGPLITGGASNVSQVIVALKGGSQATTNVMNGRWQTYLSQVYPGTYTVEVLDNDQGPNYNNVLAVGTVTVTEPTSAIPNPVINKLYASPSSVQAGNASTLYWSASNTAQCGISVISGSAPGIDLTKAVNSYDTTSVTTGPLTQTTTYELRCAPLTGASGGYAIKDVTVNVTGGQTNPVVINSFTVSSNYVLPGQQITFNWSSNLTSTDINLYGGGCYIETLTNSNAQSHLTTGGSANGSAVDYPNAPTTYTLRCYSGGKDGSPMATKQLSVVVSYAATLPRCPANAAQQRGQTGSIACGCSPGFAIGNVWGGQSYFTDNSDICTAGMMAGQMNNIYGGEVDYQTAPGLNSYPSWSNNGITSQAWNEFWPGSFKITGPKG